MCNNRKRCVKLTYNSNKLECEHRKRSGTNMVTSQTNDSFLIVLKHKKAMPPKDHNLVQVRNNIIMRQPLHEKFRQRKVLLSFRRFCIVTFLLFELFRASPSVNLLSAQASIVSVDSNGVYNKLTVKISDQVPRQLCHQTLDRLEVRH